MDFSSQVAHYAVKQPSGFHADSGSEKRSSGEIYDGAEMSNLSINQLARRSRIKTVFSDEFMSVS